MLSFPFPLQMRPDWFGPTIPPAAEHRSPGHTPLDPNPAIPVDVAVPGDRHSLPHLRPGTSRHRSHARVSTRRSA